MAELRSLTPKGRRILLAAVLLYAVVTIPLAVHKGEDIASEFAQSDLLLRGLPVYLTPQNQGVWWPPFALLSIAPFALIAHLSLPLAKGCWAAFSILCLAWSLWRTQRFGGWAMFLALLAVALPIQYNFQHLNINTPLLALAIATADDLEGHEARAGVWTAAATALKLFPGLLILLFALRRKWKAFGVASAGALLLTYASMLPYGPLGAGQAVVRWVRLDLEATSYQGAAVATLGMQKLSRLVYALNGNLVAVVIAHVALLALVWWALKHNAERGTRNAEPRAAGSAFRVPTSAFADVAVVLVAACLLSPIGWLHTFTLAYPLWVCALGTPEPGRPWWRTTLWVVAGVLASGYLAKVPWPHTLAWVAGHNDTLGSLLLLGLVATAPRE
ncbi:MAG TPA: glycosyltransferase family 87 protein [Gemmatimonadales bacterium]|nr:glycosyltransferase family 87 protein [Gemmatimonadales bacterium]